MTGCTIHSKETFIYLNTAVGPRATHLHPRDTREYSRSRIQTHRFSVPVTPSDPSYLSLRVSPVQLISCALPIQSDTEKPTSMGIKVILKWRCLPYKAYVRAKFQGKYPQNMAWHMVLTYLHFRILEFPMTTPSLLIITDQEMCPGLQSCFVFPSVNRAPCPNMEGLLERWYPQNEPWQKDFPI